MKVRIKKNELKLVEPMRRSYIIKKFTSKEYYTIVNY